MAMATEAGILEPICEKIVQEEAEELKHDQSIRIQECSKDALVNEHWHDPEAKNCETNPVAFQNLQLVGVGQNPSYGAAATTDDSSTLNEAATDDALHMLPVELLDSSEGEIFEHAPSRVQVSLGEVCKDSSASLHGENPIEKEMPETASLLQKYPKDRFEGAKDEITRKDLSTEENYIIEVAEEIQTKDEDNNRNMDPMSVEEAASENSKIVSGTVNEKQKIEGSEEISRLTVDESSATHDAVYMVQEKDEEQQKSDASVDGKKVVETGRTLITDIDDQHDTAEAEERTTYEVNNDEHKISTSESHDKIQTGVETCEVMERELSKEYETTDQKLFIGSGTDAMTEERLHGLVDDNVQKSEEAVKQSPESTVIDQDLVPENFRQRLDDEMLEKNNELVPEGKQESSESISVNPDDSSVLGVLEETGLQKDDKQHGNFDALPSLASQSPSDVPAVHNGENKDLENPIEEITDASSASKFEGEGGILKGNIQLNESEEMSKCITEGQAAEEIAVQDDLAMEVPRENLQVASEISTKQIHQDEEITSTGNKTEEHITTEENINGVHFTAQLAELVHSPIEETETENLGKTSKLVQDEDQGCEKEMDLDSMEAQNMSEIQEVSNPHNEEGLKDGDTESRTESGKLENAFERKHIEIIAKSGPCDDKSCQDGTNDLQMTETSEKENTQEVPDINVKEPMNQTENKRTLDTGTKQDKECHTLENPFNEEEHGSTGGTEEKKLISKGEEKSQEDNKNHENIENAESDLISEYQNTSTSDVIRTTENTNEKHEENADEHIGDSWVEHEFMKEIKHQEGEIKDYETAHEDIKARSLDTLRDGNIVDMEDGALSTLQVSLEDNTQKAAHPQGTADVASEKDIHDRAEDCRTIQSRGLEDQKTDEATSGEDFKGEQMEGERLNEPNELVQEKQSFKAPVVSEICRGGSIGEQTPDSVQQKDLWADKSENTDDVVSENITSQNASMEEDDEKHHFEKEHENFQRDEAEPTPEQAVAGVNTNDQIFKPCSGQEEISCKAILSDGTGTAKAKYEENPDNNIGEAPGADVQVGQDIDEKVGETHAKEPGFVCEEHIQETTIAEDKTELCEHKEEMELVTQSVPQGQGQETSSEADIASTDKSKDNDHLNDTIPETIDQIDINSQIIQDTIGQKHEEGTDSGCEEKIHQATDVEENAEHHVWKEIREPDKLEVIPEAVSDNNNQVTASEQEFNQNDKSKDENNLYKNIGEALDAYVLVGKHIDNRVGEIHAKEPGFVCEDHIQKNTNAEDKTKVYDQKEEIELLTQSIPEGQSLEASSEAEVARIDKSKDNDHLNDTISETIEQTDVNSQIIQDIVGEKHEEGTISVCEEHIHQATNIEEKAELHVEKEMKEPDKLEVDKLEVIPKSVSEDHNQVTASEPELNKNGQSRDEKDLYKNVGEVSDVDLLVGQQMDDTVGEIHVKEHGVVCEDHIEESPNAEDKAEVYEQIEEMELVIQSVPLGQSQEASSEAEVARTTKSEDNDHLNDIIPERINQTDVDSQIIQDIVGKNQEEHADSVCEDHIHQATNVEDNAALHVQNEMKEPDKLDIIPKLVSEDHNQVTASKPELDENDKSRDEKNLYKNIGEALDVDVLVGQQIDDSVGKKHAKEHGFVCEDHIQETPKTGDKIEVYEHEEGMELVTQSVPLGHSQEASSEAEVARTDTSQDNDHLNDTIPEKIEQTDVNSQTIQDTAGEKHEEGANSVHEEQIHQAANIEEHAKFHVEKEMTEPDKLEVMSESVSEDHNQVTVSKPELNENGRSKDEKNLSKNIGEAPDADVLVDKHIDDRVGEIHAKKSGFVCQDHIQESTNAEDKTKVYEHKEEMELVTQSIPEGQSPEASSEAEVARTDKSKDNDHPKDMIPEIIDQIDVDSQIIQDTVCEMHEEGANSVYEEQIHQAANIEENAELHVEHEMREPEPDKLEVIAEAVPEDDKQVTASEQSLNKNGKSKDGKNLYKNIGEAPDVDELAGQHIDEKVGEIHAKEPGYVCEDHIQGTINAEDKTEVHKHKEEIELVTQSVPEGQSQEASSEAEVARTAKSEDNDHLNDTIPETINQTDVDNQIIQDAVGENQEEGADSACEEHIHQAINIEQNEALYVQKEMKEPDTLEVIPESVSKDHNQVTASEQELNENDKSKDEKNLYTNIGEASDVDVLVWQQIDDTVGEIHVKEPGFVCKDHIEETPKTGDKIEVYEHEEGMELVTQSVPLGHSQEASSEAEVARTDTSQDNDHLNDTIPEKIEQTDVNSQTIQDTAGEKHEEGANPVHEEQIHQAANIEEHAKFHVEKEMTEPGKLDVISESVSEDHNQVTVSKPELNENGRSKDEKSLSKNIGEAPDADVLVDKHIDDRVGEIHAKESGFVCEDHIQETTNAGDKTEVYEHKEEMELVTQSIHEGQSPEASSEAEVARVNESKDNDHLKDMIPDIIDQIDVDSQIILTTVCETHEEGANSVYEAKIHQAANIEENAERHVQKEMREPDKLEVIPESVSEDHNQVTASKPELDENDQSKDEKNLYKNIGEASDADVLVEKHIDDKVGETHPKEPGFVCEDHIQENTNAEDKTEVYEHKEQMEMVTQSIPEGQNPEASSEAEVARIDKSKDNDYLNDMVPELIDQTDVNSQIIQDTVGETHEEGANSACEGQIHHATNIGGLAELNDQKEMREPDKLEVIPKTIPEDDNQVTASKPELNENDKSKDEKNLYENIGEAPDVDVLVGQHINEKVGEIHAKEPGYACEDHILGTTNAEDTTEVYEHKEEIELAAQSLPAGQSQDTSNEAEVVRTDKSEDHDHINDTIPETIEQTDVNSQIIRDTVGEKHEESANSVCEEHIYQATNIEQNVELRVRKEMEEPDKLEVIPESVPEDHNQVTASEPELNENDKSKDKKNLYKNIGEAPDAGVLVRQHIDDRVGEILAKEPGFVCEDHIQETTIAEDKKEACNHEEETELFDQTQEESSEAEVARIDKSKGNADISNMIPQTIDPTDDSKISKVEDEDNQNKSTTDIFYSQIILDTVAEKLEEGTNSVCKEQIHRATNMEETAKLHVRKNLTEPDGIEVMAESVPEDHDQVTAGEPKLNKSDKSTGDDNLSIIISGMTNISDDIETTKAVDHTICARQETAPKSVHKEGNKELDAGREDKKEVDVHKIEMDSEKSEVISQSVPEHQSQEKTSQSEATKVGNSANEISMPEIVNPNDDPETAKVEGEDDLMKSIGDIPDAPAMNMEIIHNGSAEEQEQVSNSLCEEQMPQITNNEHDLATIEKESNDNKDLLSESMRKYQNQETSHAAETIKIESTIDNDTMHNIITSLSNSQPQMEENIERERGLVVDTEMNASGSTEVENKMESPKAQEEKTIDEANPASSLDLNDEALNAKIEESIDQATSGLSLYRNVLPDTNELDSQRTLESITMDENRDEEIHKKAETSNTIFVAASIKESKEPEKITEVLGEKLITGEVEAAKVADSLTSGFDIVEGRLQEGTGEDKFQEAAHQSIHRDQSNETNEECYKKIIVSNKEDKENAKTTIDDLPATAELLDEAALQSLHSDQREIANKIDNPIHSVVLNQEVDSGLTSTEKNLETAAETESIITEETKEFEVVNLKDQESASKMDYCTFLTPPLVESLDSSCEKQIHEDNSLGTLNAENYTVKLERTPELLSEDQSDKKNAERGIIMDNKVDSTSYASQDPAEEKTNKGASSSKVHEHGNEAMEVNESVQATTPEEDKTPDGESSGSQMKGIEDVKLKEFNGSVSEEKPEDHEHDMNEEEETSTKEEDTSHGTPSNMVFRKTIVAAQVQHLSEKITQEEKTAKCLKDKVASDLVPQQTFETITGTGEIKDKQQKDDRSYNLKDDSLSTKESSAEESMHNDASAVVSEEHIHERAKDNEITEKVIAETENKQKQEAEISLQADVVKDDKKEKRAGTQEGQIISETVSTCQDNKKYSEEKEASETGSDIEKLENSELKNALNVVREEPEAAIEKTDISTNRQEKENMDDNFEASFQKDGDKMFQAATIEQKSGNLTHEPLGACDTEEGKFSNKEILETVDKSEVARIKNKSPVRTGNDLSVNHEIDEGVSDEDALRSCLPVEASELVTTDKPQERVEGTGTGNEKILAKNEALYIFSQRDTEECIQFEENPNVVFDQLEKAEASMKVKEKITGYEYVTESPEAAGVMDKTAQKEIREDENEATRNNEARLEAEATITKESGLTNYEVKRSDCMPPEQVIDGLTEKIEISPSNHEDAVENINVPSVMTGSVEEKQEIDEELDKGSHSVAKELTEELAKEETSDAYDSIEVETFGDPSDVKSVKHEETLPNKMFNVSSVTEASGRDKTEEGSEKLLEISTTVSLEQLNVKNETDEALKVLESEKVQPLAHILQSTNEEAENLLEKRGPSVGIDEMQSKEAEEVQVEEEKTDEEKDEKEDEVEHKTDQVGQNEAVIVEARDADSKPAHKKHHNILSGVGSRVKHSIAKVKKAITGKSSHPKQVSLK